MVAVGDYVVVPGCGVGVVQAREQLDVGGGPVEVFRIDLGPEAGVLWVPVDRVAAEGIRAPAEAERVEQAWELIAAQEAPETRTNWNRRHRRYTEMVMSNQPRQLGALIGELIAVREAKRAKRQVLSFQERRYLEKATRLLAEETAVVRGGELQAITEDLEKHIAAA